MKSSNLRLFGLISILALNAVPAGRAWMPTNSPQTAAKPAEVVLSPDQSEAEADIIARDLMTKPNIQERDLIEGAYIDLLESDAGNVPPFDS